MHPRDQKTIREIAIRLLVLRPEQDRTEENARRAFALARQAVEETTGTKQSDADHEKQYQKFATPK